VGAINQLRKKKAAHYHLYTDKMRRLTDREGVLLSGTLADAWPEAAQSFLFEQRHLLDIGLTTRCR